MIRARGALLTNVDSLASHALAELRGILGELGDCKKESDSFQEHQVTPASLS